MLYRRGRPTSVVLLLLMVISKLSLPLSRHPPLCLHHLLRLVGAARGLVSLGGVKVLQVRLLVSASTLSEFAYGWRSVTGSRPRTPICDIQVSFPYVGGSARPVPDGSSKVWI